MALGVFHIAAHMVTPVVPITGQGQELVPVSITALSLL